MTDCECGWLLSQEGTCGNPNHNEIYLREAAEQACAALEALARALNYER